MMDSSALPENWAAVTLETVAEIHDNLREPVNSTERKSRVGPFPYYGATGQVGWIDDFRQDGEYVLLGEDGAPFFDPTKDKAYLVSGKCWVNNHAHVLKAREGVCLNRYLLYALNQVNYRGFANGTTRLKLTQAAMRQLPINLAPLAEQHRIVAKIEELFSELDQGVASLKTAREQLNVYRQSLLKNAFEGKLTAAWRTAHRDQLETATALQQRIAHERQTRYQQQLADWQTAGQPGPKPKPPKPLPPLTAEELAELPELPEGWAYSYLADMGDLGRGKSKHRPRNDPRLFGGSFPFIQTGEVKAANQVIRSYSQTYSEFGLAQSKLWPKGTLCITIAANIAQTAFLGFDGCFPDSVVGFTAFEPVVRAEYIDYFIQAARTRIEAYAPATAQKNINLETLENLVVPYCSHTEQEAVLCELESKLSEADQLDQTLATALQQADALRQSILKKAFHGQLVKQDKNEEPATALLERIRAARATSPAKGRQAKMVSKPLANC